MVGVLGQQVAAAFRDLRELVLTDLSPDECVVRRETLVSDGGGGQTRTTTTVWTGPCKLAVSGSQGRESISADVPYARGSYLLKIPLTTTDLETGEPQPPVEIEPTDQIVVNGRPFDVVGVPRRGGLLATALLVELEVRS